MRLSLLPPLSRQKEIGRLFYLVPILLHEHQLMDALAHAQVAQAKRHGYRDAETRYG